MKKCICTFGLLFLLIYCAGGVDVYAAVSTEREDNGSADKATSIELNCEVGGNIAEEEDIDYYRLSISSPGKVSITFRHPNLMSDERYWVIRIYNAKTEELACLDSKGIDTDGTGAEVGLPAGTYYVKINAYGPYCYDSSAYSFKVNYTKSDVWEQEPNDEYATANPIKVNTAYHGAIQYEEEEDYYVFNVSSPGRVSITFRHPNLMSDERYWVIRIYNVKVEELACLDSKGIDTDGTGAEVGLPAGTYYVKINAYGPYCYDSSAYSFKVNYTKSDVWEQEPNDEYAAANPIKEDVTYYGANQFSEDIDCYKFTVPQSQYVSIIFSHAYIGNTDRFWVARIIDTKTNERGFLESKGVDKRIQSNRVYLTAGTYYLKVNSDDAESWCYNYSSETYSFCISSRNKSSSPSKKLKSGKTTYKITKSGTVAFTKLSGKPSKVTIPATIKIGGLTYKVTSIAANAFKNNKKLTKVKIGSNIKTIGKNAFSGCRKLKSITIKTKKLTAKSIGAKAFAKAGSSNYKKLVVKAPKSKKKAYTKLFRKKGLSKKVRIR